MTRFPSLDVMQYFNGRWPIAILEGHLRGLLSEAELSSHRSFELSGVVLRSSLRSSLWIDRLLPLVLVGRGGGEVRCLLVMI
jgi:hypothetical protein